MFGSPAQRVEIFSSGCRPPPFVCRPTPNLLQHSDKRDCLPDLHPPESLDLVQPGLFHQLTLEDRASQVILDVGVVFAHVLGIGEFSTVDHPSTSRSQATLSLFIRNSLH